MDPVRPTDSQPAQAAEGQTVKTELGSPAAAGWKKKKKRKTSPKIVAVAIIEKDGAILIGKRKWGTQFVGSWEFPGGTVEEGETPEECLRRELEEELAVPAEIGELFCVTEHTYEPGWTIRLLAYRVRVTSDRFVLSDHDEIRWVRPEELTGYRFPDADEPIVELLANKNNPH